MDTPSLAGGTDEPAGADPLARLAARKAARTRFLHALYDCAGGSADALVHFDELRSELGFTPEQGWTIRRYLAHEGLVRGATTSAVRITHLGIKHVEAALADPPPAADPEPYTENVIVIASAEGAVIQQGNENSAQEVELSAGTLDEARRRAAELEARVRAVELEGDELRALIAEATTAAAQLKSRRPALGAVRETVAAVRDVLEAAVASGKAAAGILSALGAARALLALLA